MKTDRILLILLLSLLAIGVILPIFVLTLAKNNSIAGQIGDTLGGTTAPFVNISAILIVLVTYNYQKKNDKKNYEKDLIFETFQNLKLEFDKINFDSTTTVDKKKEVTNHSGKKAFNEIVKYMTGGSLTLDELQEWDVYKAIFNVFQSTEALLTTVRVNNRLSDYEKQLYLSQISLFYRNNLFIRKDKRGDEVCEYHNVRHEIPNSLYDLINKIESQII